MELFLFHQRLLLLELYPAGILLLRLYLLLALGADCFLV